MAGEEALEWVAGATVRIKGLRSKPKLNGQDGTLVSCDSAGRWTVLLGDGDTACLQEKFLDLRAPPAPPPPSPPRARSPSPEVIGGPPSPAGHFAPEAQEGPFFQPAHSAPWEPAASASGILGPEHFFGSQGDVITDGAAFEAEVAPPRAGASSRRRNLWAQPREERPPPEPVAAAEPPASAPSGGSTASSSRMTPKQAKASKMEAKLDSHMAALQAMMAEEQRKKDMMMRQREAAPVVPSMGALLTTLDREDEEAEDPEEVLPAPEPARSSGSGARTGGPPRSFKPAGSRDDVPDIGQLLAELDSQEKAHQNTPSLDQVLACIDEDEEVDSSRNAFLMLGSGVEPEPDKPTDPLAKMIQMTSSFKAADLIPTKEGKSTEEERRPQMIGLVSRRAQWRDDTLHTSPHFVTAPIEDNLLGEGPLFGGGGGAG